MKKVQETKKYENLGTIGYARTHLKFLPLIRHAARYCFGGGVAMQLGATMDLFNSIILVHPSPPSDAHVKAIKVIPLSIL